jgi:hypothetical protein
MPDRAMSDTAVPASPPAASADAIEREVRGRGVGHGRGARSAGRRPAAELRAGFNLPATL